jgi:N-acetylmuramoyl-L-alanine amidase
MQYKIKSRCEQLGIKVFLTNPNPATVSDIALGVRAKSANDYWIKNNKCKAIFISIHANAFSNASARGTETYVAKNASTISKDFAKVLNNNIVKAMKEIDPAAKDRGVKTENFTVIYKASMPSVLVEYAFYSNLEDLKILKNNQAELVEATVKAICSYFNIEYKEKVVKKDDNLYAVCVGAYKDRNKANAIVEELKKKGYTSTYLIIR